MITVVFVRSGLVFGFKTPRSTRVEPVGLERIQRDGHETQGEQMGVSGIPLVGVGCHGVEFWVDGKVIHLRALSGGSVMRGVQICPRGSAAVGKFTI